MENTYHADVSCKGDPRGISLTLCTDCVNPFAHNQVSYSMWPIMLNLLNLPKHNNEELFASIMLVDIVPSRSPNLYIHTLMFL